MAVPCIGLRVLDFSWGMPGAIATMVLSDFGAQVIKVEPPAGDPFRSHPGWLAWNRGKQGIVLDLKSDEGREQARRLAETADVLVETFRPGVADRLGIGYASLSSVNPRLVYCSLSSFGQRGRLRNLKGYEGIVAAKAGRMLGFAGQTQREGPVYAAVQTASWASSQAAVQGILAALRLRERSGRGQWVQTSMLQGMIPYDFQGLVIRQLTRKDPVRFPGDPLAALRRAPTLQYLPVQCKDGRWIQLANNMPRLFQSFIRVIGLWHIYRDERFKNAPDLTPENREILRDMILERMREKTLDEWMALFIEDGDVAAEPFLPTLEGMKHTQFVHNRHAIEINDPRVGPMQQLGLLVDLAGTPGAVQGVAPDLGQHTAEVLAGLQKQQHPPAGSSAGNNGPSRSPAPANHPLAGVTVLEFATVIAGPLSAALLADLGARVIKVEPPEGDPIRVMGGGQGTGAIRTTAGKESIQLDLKTEEGQQIIRQLIARSDILLHNFRPGVPERLGIDYESARAINPDLIYVYAGGYGATGPHHRRPAFHPLPGALLGGALLQAGRAMPPSPATPLAWDELKEVSRWLFRANEGNPDPNSSMAIATGMLLGLYARERTGQGQAVQVTMIAANAYANADEAFSYAGRPPRPVPDAECYGLHALYRLYRASEGWVFLACLFEREWQDFCRAVGRPDLLADPRFQTKAARRAHDPELIAVLEALFQTRPASVWEKLLTAADVACVQADAADMGTFFGEEPHIRDNSFLAQTEHARFGDYWRHSGMVQLSESPGRYGPGVLAGQHTVALLKELGYTEEQIAMLKARAVVFWEATDPIGSLR